MATSTEPRLQRILDFLGNEKIRATYGAVGEALGLPGRAVGEMLGNRRPEASWVVSAETGEPTGYLPVEVHPDLRTRSQLVRSGQELLQGMSGLGLAAGAPPNARNHVHGAAAKMTGTGVNPIDWTRLQPVIEKMQGESDRACAVLGLATLDFLLGVLLRKAMIADRPKDLFERFGPLATLSAKIELAYAFGLISTREYRDLNLLRRIRNDFAHAIDHELEFQSGPIAERILELSLPRLFAPTPMLRAPNDTPRFRFELGVSVVALLLNDLRVRQTKPPIVPVESELAEEAAKKGARREGGHCA